MDRYIIVPNPRQQRVIQDFRQPMHSRVDLKSSFETAFREDPVVKEFSHWLSEHVGSEKVNLLSKHHSKVAPSVVLAEMSTEQASALGRDIRDVVVLRDRPMRLINPTSAGSSFDLHDLTPDLLWHLEAIGLNEARSRGLIGSGHDIAVAVLDTGVNASHPEFRSGSVQLFRNAGQAIVPDNALEDHHGHGTHVAGLIAGQNIGVAPDVDIWGVQMLQGDTGQLSDFILSLQWLSTQPEVQVVNISAGLPTGDMSPQELQALEASVDSLASFGMLVVGAVGNEGRDYTVAPANLRRVLAVGASTQDERVPGFSGSGQVLIDNTVVPAPDMVAPGRDVVSSIPGGRYEAWNGTSMAAPLVSGIAALLLEQDQGLSILELRERLLDMCRPLTTNPQPVRQGAGIPRFEVP